MHSSEFGVSNSQLPPESKSDLSSLEKRRRRHRGPLNVDLTINLLVLLSHLVYHCQTITKVKLNTAIYFKYEVEKLAAVVHVL